MLQQLFSHEPIFANLDVLETFESVRIEATIQAAPEHFIFKIFDQLRSISNRDRFELFFEVDGSGGRVDNCSAESYRLVEDFSNEYRTATRFEINLQVRKAVASSTLSVYFLSAFTEYLISESIHTLLRIFASRHASCLIFEVFGATETIRTNSIAFVSIGSYDALTLFPSDRLTSRAQILAQFEENGINTNVVPKLVPDDFSLQEGNSNAAISQLFAVVRAALSVVFLSNFSSFEGEKFSFKMFGYRIVSESQIDPRSFLVHSDLLYRIYAWAYSNGNNSDKIGLVRNVFSLHADSNGKVIYSQGIWDAVQSNYQIYLKNNVENYLEVKNKLAEFIVESTTKTHALADELIDSFKNNLLALMTFLLTVVLINGLKDTGEITVFSNSYLYVVFALAAVSAVWLLMNNIEVLRRFDATSQTISAGLKENYSQVLLASEIDASINPTVSLNRKYLYSQVSRYRNWWILMLVVFVASFVLGNRLTVHDQERKISGNENANGKQQKASASQPNRNAQLLPVSKAASTKASSSEKETKKNNNP